MTFTLPLPKSGAILGTAQTVFVLLFCQLFLCSHRSKILLPPFSGLFL